MKLIRNWSIQLMLDAVNYLYVLEKKMVSTVAWPQSTSRRFNTPQRAATEQDGLVEEVVERPALSDAETDVGMVLVKDTSFYSQLLSALCFWNSQSAN